ncbi:hypothetical protein [Pseudactinotalea terrae]|uniref:hypothetical protein n=1 Tax=Pseudactinotalea terrae TaxID=1743262 RepID=UPI0012E1C470|nr:hypothetical protein [Pseudactinotalea terrae]
MTAPASPITAPRVPAGVREGGQWTTTTRHESPVALTATNEQDRHTALRSEGFVPATVLREGPTAHADTWWDRHFIAAEYRAAAGGYPQMPDDYGTTATGRGLRGRRRVARMTYSGAGVQLQMPAAESVRSFVREENGTVDVPISATVEGRPVTGWIRITPRPGGGYATAGVGFEAGDELVAEAVSAVLESRRPRKALREVGDLLARARARDLGTGAPLQPVESSWVEAIGYDESTGTMATRTATGALYGHEVSRDRFLAVAGAASPGAQFNRIIKGNTRAQVANCLTCGRFYSAAKQHACPVTPTTPKDVPIEQNVLARRRAAKVTAPPRRPGEHVRQDAEQSIDMADWATQRLARRARRVGMFGPPGFTTAITGPLGRYTSSTYNAYAFNSWEIDGERFERINGDNGSMRYAGVSGADALAIGKTLPKQNLADRHHNAPTTRSALLAAVRHPGKVEVAGYVIGPDREDERFSVTSIDLHDADATDPDAAITLMRERYGLDFLAAPERIQRVEVPWRPGESAWRLWWR